MLASAAAADERRAKGEALSEFDGIPVGIKDNICVKGERCSCASKLLENLISPYDATAVERLRKQGFIPFGISKGSCCKYELDKYTGLLRLDRVLYTSTHYPANYGFIPRTYADDGDPLDVLVICSQEILPMTLIRVMPIGVMRMLDGGAIDDKIIAVPFSDPTYNYIRSIDELPPHIFDEIMHYYSVYKQLENKQTAVKELLNADDAKRIISECIDNYNKSFGNK
ncbi:MAG: inorganic diphosphatase [Lentisphaeria bacterium]|nr:inorganic diphosphatase [Lentisphaeria bacterium]